MRLLTRLPILLSLLVFSLSSFGQNWTDLFNGKDLSNFKKLNGTAEYHIEGNEIVGVTKMNTPNTFLATKEMYGDFILEVEYKVDHRMNSGIQIRSNSLADYKDGRVHGYQIEIDPSGRAWSCGIYDEARRGWLYPLDQNPKARKAFKQNQWNHYRIEAIGPSIRTWINGVPAADLVDDMTDEGFIALQVHSIGNEEAAGREIRWRNIRIQTSNLVPSPWTDIPVVNLIPNFLSPQERAQGWELLFDGKTTANWRGAHKDYFPSSGWHIENGELVVESQGGKESQGAGDIVTQEEYDLFEFQLEFKLSKAGNSGIKYFITEQYLNNSPGKASAIGLEYQLLDKDHPDAKAGTDGNRTLASLYDLIPSHKKKTVKKVGEWNHARLIVSGVRQDEWISGGNQSARTLFKGAHVEHWLNYRKVLEYERGTQAFDALVARSKYKDWEGFGHWQSGHILLQEHGDEVHFRSIKVRRLSE